MAKGSEPQSQEPQNLEPWMRGSWQQLEPVQRAAVHALEQTLEDAERWCACLNTPQMNATPHGLPSVAFHLRHIARSLKRLRTYSAGALLDDAQLSALATEHDPVNDAAAVLTEFRVGVHEAITWAGDVPTASFAQPRGIGRRQLPTTVAGLLIHCAEHTQRHAGQFVTTAKLVLSAA